MNPSIEELTARYLRGDLNDAEVTALEQRLRVDDAERAEFRRAARLGANLRAQATERRSAGAAWAAPRPQLKATLAESLRAWLRRWRAPVATATAVVLLATGAWFFLRPQVTLLRGVGQEFANAASLPEGELIGPSVELKQGLLELRFRRADATVVIEAPAKFRIEDGKTLRMESGRVTAHVKDGRQGLRVLTPHTDVLDLGTRFAVDVIAGQRSEVHVFEGKVEAGDRPLVANEALRFALNVAPEARQVRTASFVQPEEMKSLAAAFRDGRSDRASRAAVALRKDAATLAFLDFTPSADGRQLTTGQAMHGAQWVQGRFPGRHGLEFLEADDHVKIDLPQRCRQLTMMTWVRLDRVPGGASSIFHTDDWKTPGQVHWTLHDRGGMLFSMFDQEFPVEPDRPRSWPRSVLPLMDNFGGWMHLALVYDAEAKEVRFYSNGRPDGGRKVLLDLPAVLGPAQIGNWNVKDWQDRNPLFNRHDRRLSGRMDEFVVLARAMSAGEIADYFQETNPYQ